MRLQHGWLANAWHGLQLLLAAVPLAKWGEFSAFDGYLSSRRREFQQARQHCGNLQHGLLSRESFADSGSDQSSAANIHSRNP